MPEIYDFEFHIKGLSHGPRGIVVGRGSGSPEAVHAYAKSLVGADCNELGFETMVLYMPTGEKLLLVTHQKTKRLKFAYEEDVKRIKAPTFDSPGID